MVNYEKKKETYLCFVENKFYKIEKNLEGIEIKRIKIGYEKGKQNLSQTTEKN